MRGQWHGLKWPGLATAPSLIGARAQYMTLAGFMPSPCANLAARGQCNACEEDGLMLDGASIALDLAVSVAHPSPRGVHLRLAGGAG